MTNPVTSGQVTVKLYFNEGRPGTRGADGPPGEVPAERQITAGAGLTGGGDLSVDREIAVDFEAEEWDAFSRVGVSSQSASYTLAASDAGSVVRVSSSSTATVTVPANVFTAGDVVEVMQYGSGGVTVAAGAGMTLRTGGKGLVVAQQYGSVSIVFVSATEAVVTGGVA